MCPGEGESETTDRARAGRCRRAREEPTPGQPPSPVHLHPAGSGYYCPRAQETSSIKLSLWVLGDRPSFGKFSRSFISLASRASASKLLQRAAPWEGSGSPFPALSACLRPTYLPNGIAVSAMRRTVYLMQATGTEQGLPENPQSIPAVPLHPFLPPISSLHPAVLTSRGRAEVNETPEKLTSRIADRH